MKEIIEREYIKNEENELIGVIEKTTESKWSGRGLYQDTEAGFIIQTLEWYESEDKEKIKDRIKERYEKYKFIIELWETMT